MTDIFLTYFEMSLSIGVIAAALMLLAPFLNKRYAAKWKYLIWICLALRLLIPFNVGYVQPVRDMPLQAEAQTSFELEEKHKEPPADAAMTPRPVIVEIPSQMTAPIAVPTLKSKRSISMLDIAAFVWMIGNLVFISVHLVSYLLYKRQVVGRGTVIEDTGILYQISELKQELHIKGAVRAIEYPQADSPMLIGFLEPVLVLPEEQYSPEELFFILKHELVHLKRKDVFFKLLFVAANAAHWFNPLIWFMQKEAAVDMELSCDERVTRGTDYAVRKAYTETLLSTIHKRGTKRTALSTQFYGGKRIMKKRFNNILTKTGKKNGTALLICAVIIIASLGTLMGCTLVKRNTEAASGQPGGEEGLSNISSETDASENVTTIAAAEKRMLTSLRFPGDLGDGGLFYTAPIQKGQDYKLYFYAQKDPDEDDIDYDERVSDLNLDQADFVFPDVRENNMSIGKFTGIYFNYCYTTKSGEDGIIIIATYEMDGRQYYDTRIYTSDEEGYVVNDSETKKLNDLYSDVKEYSVGQVVELLSDAENVGYYGHIKDTFVVANLFSNDLVAEKWIGPTFDIDLNEWGKVTFVTLEPEHEFYLLGNGKVLYQFPHVSDFDPCDVSYVFSGDINGDNKNEIMIIFKRYTGEVLYTKLCIYEDHGDEFVYNKYLTDEINKNLPAGILDSTGIYNWIYSHYIIHMDTFSATAFDIMTFF